MTELAPLFAHLPLPADADAPVQSLRVSDSGQWIAAGNTMRQLCLFRSGELIHRIDLRGMSEKMRTIERIRSIAFDPDDNLVYAASGDTVHAIDLVSGRTLWQARTNRLFAFLGIIATAVATARDGRVAIAFDNGHFGIRDPKGIRLRAWRDNAGPRWMGFSPDGTRIIGSDGFTVRQWNALTGETLHVDRQYKRIYSLAVSPVDEAYLVRTMGETCLHMDGDHEPKVVIPAGIGLPMMAFSHFHRRFALGHEHDIGVYSFEGQLERTIDVPDTRVLCVEFEPDGEGILFGCSNGQVRQAFS